MKRFKMLLLLLLIFFAGLFFVSIDNNSHNISSYKEHPDTYTEGYVCHPATITPYTKASSVYPGPQKKTSFRRGSSFMLRMPVLHACCRIPFLLGLPAKYRRLLQLIGSLFASMIFMLQIWIIHQVVGKKRSPLYETGNLI